MNGHFWSRQKINCGEPLSTILFNTLINDLGKGMGADRADFLRTRLEQSEGNASQNEVLSYTHSFAYRDEGSICYSQSWI